MCKKEYLTTSTGAPVDNNQSSQTVGARGPVLLQDIYLLDKLASFDRERIPERVVHAKGVGAHGYFKVYRPMAKYTRAKFLQDPNKKTDVFVRFSTVDRKSTRLNSSHANISYAVFCLKKKNTI